MKVLKRGPEAPPVLLLQFLDDADRETNPCINKVLINYNVTFVTGDQGSGTGTGQSDTDASSTRRRKLLKSLGGSSTTTTRFSGNVGAWGGYNVKGILDVLYHVNLTDAPELPRWLGGSKGSNRVLGGLVLHQTRGSMLDPDACTVGFPSLSAKCSDKLFAERYEKYSGGLCAFP